MTVLLHHLTTKAGLDGILGSGAIAATWPRVLPGWPWRRVVWLTTQPDPNRQGWKVDQTFEVRFTVDVPDQEADAWSACKAELPNNAVSALERWGNPADWYVVRRPILKTEWIEVIDLTTNELIAHDSRR